MKTENLNKVSQKTYSEISDKWEAGDKFTCDKSEFIYTVTRHNENCVEAVDYGSKTGFTIFPKKTIIKVK